MTAEPQSMGCPGAILGEGPVWVARESALWFVDIKGRTLHRFDPGRKALRSWPAPAQVGWIVPTVDGLFAVGLQTGIHAFDPDRSTFTLWRDPEPGLPGNRLNDATVDGYGRLWFGSMDDGECEESGRVYRVHRGSCAATGLPPVAIVNGPAVSADGTLLYHVDTLGRTIWKSQIDAAGDVAKTTLFAQIEDGAGYPDGPVVDAEGCLWIGLFGGWGVRRYDPSGRLMTHIAFPVANITKVAFGGDDLSTGYVTTARKGLDEADLRRQPLAGDLFAFEPGVRGLPGHPAIL